MLKYVLAVVLLVIAGVAYLVFTEPRAAGPTQEENIRFGFIKSVSTNGNYGIAFDEAEWLTGEEGKEAAIKAGLCTEATRSECLPNDFLIQNPSTAVENLEFGTDIVIAMFTLNMEEGGVKETQISKEEFERLINDGEANWSDVPYQILVKNGLVQIIEEVYVP